MGLGAVDLLGGYQICSYPEVKYFLTFVKEIIQGELTFREKKKQKLQLHSKYNLPQNIWLHGSYTI